MSRLEIWAATPTPFGPGGELDLGIVTEQAARLAPGGVTGALVTGTTGEFAAMTVEERRAVVEAWSRCRPSGFGLAAQVGDTSLVRARELAAHAQECGVDMIAAMAPYYGEASDADHLVAFLQEIAAAAARTPFCYYHIPGMTGSGYGPSDVIGRAVREIPTLAAVKFTDGDLLELDRLRETAPELKIFFGRDELLPAGLAFGVDAVIGSLYNGLAPVAHQVTEAFDAGQAREAFALHRPFREIAAGGAVYGGPGFVKEVLNVLGPDAGPARPPWGPMGPAAREAVDRLAATVRPALR